MTKEIHNPSSNLPIMTILQKNLRYVCNELGLECIAPFILEHEDLTIHAEALLPELGGAKGTIVVSSFEKLLGVERSLVRLGFGYSVLDIEEAINAQNTDHISSYVEMFSEWGWAADPQLRPDWFTDVDDIDDDEYNN